MADKENHGGVSGAGGTDSGGGVGTAPPKTQKKAARKPAPAKAPPKLLPPWKVLLHNDDVNDMLHVVETIIMLTPLGKQMAVLRMLEAHEAGVALLLTTHQERAELYRDQFATRGIIVTIEPGE